MKQELIRRLGTAKEMSDALIGKIIDKVYAEEIKAVEQAPKFVHESHCEFCGLAHMTGSPDCRFYVRPERIL